MNECETLIFLSNREIPLVAWKKANQEFSIPILTVENYLKWYNLYLINPDNSVKKISFGVLEDYRGDESAYCDHVPNPKAVIAYAEAMNYKLDSQSLEMIIGRWHREYLNQYEEY